MLRAAFFSDVHGNLPALVSLFERLDTLGVDHVYAAGDYVGFGPLPAETLKTLRARNVIAIQGNCDAGVAAWRETAAGAGDPVAAWTARRLDRASRQWLGALPPRHAFTLAGHRVLVVHGSAVSATDGITAALTVGGLEEKLGNESADLLVCGHTHLPFVKVVAGVTVVNCGSAGRPLDGDPRGSFALVEIPPHGEISAQVIRFDYPVEELVAEIEQLHPPRVRAADYRLGRVGG